MDIYGVITHNLATKSVGEIEPDTAVQQTGWNNLTATEETF